MNPDPRVHVTLSHLRSLQGPARGLSFLPRTSSTSALSGRHATRLRGRGLNFEEMRNYLPGDDIRSIDWKATARTGTPYVRVFTEERDRPALALPGAQSVDDVLTTYGWRQSRQNPVTTRDDGASPLQTLILANGVVGTRIVRLSDDSRFTEL